MNVNTVKVNKNKRNYVCDRLNYVQPDRKNRNIMILNDNTICVAACGYVVSEATDGN